MKNELQQPNEIQGLDILLEDDIDIDSETCFLQFVMGTYLSESN
ncbi:hypothetical protein [Solibacillus sp. FSL K6-1523]